MQIASGASIGSGEFSYKELHGQSKYIGGNSQVLCSFNNKTVSWHNCYSNFSYARNAINQMNNSGTTYYYIAIG